jgi:glutathione S-transferase
MTYVLHYHPLSSFCWKVQIALDEGGVKHERVVVNLGDPAERAAYLKISPLGKIPALVDKARNTAVVETSLIVEYLALNESSARHLLPVDAVAAMPVRELDRYFDTYVQHNMQKIVLDNARPEGSGDPYGVTQARNDMKAVLDWLERKLPKKGWATGDTFNMADCAACPALYYANYAQPFETTHPNVFTYFMRLKARPSFARALEEAQPFLHWVPKVKQPESAS